MRLNIWTQSLSKLDKANTRSSVDPRFPSSPEKFCDYLNPNIMVDFEQTGQKHAWHYHLQPAPGKLKALLEMAPLCKDQSSKLKFLHRYLKLTTKAVIICWVAACILRTQNTNPNLPKPSTNVLQAHSPNFLLLETSPRIFHSKE